MFAQHGADFGEAGRFGILEAVGDETGTDVDAVEHIADVVEHTGRDFSHTRLAGNFHELFMSGFEFGFGFLNGRNVLRDAKGADDLAVRVAPRQLAGQRPREAAI